MIDLELLRKDFPDGMEMTILLPEKLKIGAENKEGTVTAKLKGFKTVTVDDGEESGNVCLLSGDPVGISAVLVNVRYEMGYCVLQDPKTKKWVREYLPFVGTIH